MRRKVALMLVLCMVLGAVGFGTIAGAEEAADEKVTILFIDPLIGNPITARIADAFQEAADEFGFEAIYGGTANNEFDKVIEEIERGIAEGVDGIVTDGSAEAALLPVFKKANERGIKTAMYFIDLPDVSLRTTSVLTNSEEIGYIAAEALHDALGGEDLKLGCISGSLDAVDEMNQRVGAQKYCDEHPGCEIITTVVDEFDPIKAETEYSNLLKGYPEINAIFGTEGNQATGFDKAMASMDLDTKSMPTITMDDVDENLAALKNGRILGLMAQDFYAMGYTNGKNVYLAIKGEPYEDAVLAPGYLVTADNIDTYLDDWKAANK